MAYSARVVEQITGYSAGLLRKWEERGIYICDLRRSSEFRLSLVVSPEDERGKIEAETTLRRLNSGWREYTFTDLMRLTAMRQLTESGVSLTVAGQMALRIWARSEEQERALALKESESGRPEVLFFRPKFPSLGNSVTRRSEDLYFAAASSALPVIAVSLTSIRKDTLLALSRLEEAK